MSDNFAYDPKIRQIAEAYALDAVDFAAQKFGIKLDWTDGSIADVEAILGQLYAMKAKARPKPTAEQVEMFAKMFGSYIGEVFRRNHGAEWGIIDQSFPGMRAMGAAGLFWPWGKVENRLENGDEDDVNAYYRILIGA